MGDKADALTIASSLASQTLSGEECGVCVIITILGVYCVDCIIASLIAVCISVHALYAI